jgi:2-oxoglutarate ferredoxin oxidoreductase subunit beta
MRNEFATGILYVEPDKPDFIDMLGLVDEPLAQLDESRTRPGKAALDEIMESFR